MFISRFLTVTRLSILIVLSAITLMGCEPLQDSVVVYCMNDTNSNFHIGSKNGRRIRQGEVSKLPIAFIIFDEKHFETANRAICRDDGCLAEIEISYKVNPGVASGPYQDTIVVEEPEINTFSAYSLFDYVRVSIKPID